MKGRHEWEARTENYNRWGKRRRLAGGGNGQPVYVISIVKDTKRGESRLGGEDGLVTENKTPKGRVEGKVPNLTSPRRKTRVQPGIRSNGKKRARLDSCEPQRSSRPAAEATQLVGEPQTPP